MASVRNLIVIIGVLNILKRVSCDYPCICNYHVELTVTNSPNDKGTLIGYMYEFDCKPQAFVKDLDSKWLAVAFEKKLGYVQKDEQVQIQKCPGNQPEEDKLPTTTTVWTTPLTTMTKSTITTPFTTTTQLTTTPSTTKTESTTTTTPSTTFAKSTIHITSSSLPVTSSAKTLTTTQQTVTTTSPFTTTKSTVPTTPSITNSQLTLTTTLPTTMSSPPPPTTPIKTTIHSTVPTLTTTVATQSSATTSPSITASTHQPNIVVQAPHILLKVSLQTSSCNNSAFQLGHFCYQIVTQPLMWDVAELYCKKNGGHLLSITNANEEEYIYQLLNEFHLNEPMWTGLNDKLQEGIFEWSSGDPSSYHDVLNWKQQIKHPNNNEEDCVVLEASKYPLELDDINCLSGRAFICKEQANIQLTYGTSISTLQPSSSTNSPDLCYGERFLWRDYCWEYVKNIKPCYLVESYCNNNGGSLAAFSNDTEKQTFFKDHNILNQVWISDNCKLGQQHLPSDQHGIPRPFICMYGLSESLNMVYPKA